MNSFKEHNQSSNNLINNNTKNIHSSVSAIKESQTLLSKIEEIKKILYYNTYLYDEPLNYKPLSREERRRLLEELVALYEKCDDKKNESGLTVDDDYYCI